MLLVMMRDANPLLYQQVARGNNFFAPQGDISRQKRLYHYIRSQEYLHHHDDAFIAKCNKVRHLFILSTTLVLALVLSLLFCGICWPLSAENSIPGKRWQTPAFFFTTLPFVLILIGKG